MKERIIFGGIGAVLAICAFLFASETLVLALIAIVTLMSVTEFLKAVSILDGRNKLLLNILNYLFCIGLIVTVSFDSVRFQNAYLSGFGCSMPVVSVYIIAAFVVMVINHSRVKFADVAMSLLGIFYITVSLMHVILLRTLPQGKMYMWLPFIIAWLTDTFAYFVGVFFGKHKLIPEVSPKKTIEGSIGGIFGGIITVVVYQLVCSKVVGVNPDYLMGAVMAVVCSVASQFGDLAASCIKREHGIKDFGSLMPGHGGAFDRFDSVIFISPLVFWFVFYFGIF